MIASRGSPPRRRLPPTRTLPARRSRIPESASASSRWPLPATPATPTISPSRTANETSFTAISPRSPTTVKPVHFEGPDVGQRPRLLERSRDVDLPTDHEGGERAERGRLRIDGGHGPATAQHRHAVGDGLDLVELVRDEDDGLPLLGHRAQGFEESFGLLRSEHGGRLVHDQNARLAVERLQDLDALLLADRELPDPRLGIDREAVAAAQLPDALLDRARMDDEAPPVTTVVAEDDVLGHRERLDETEVLVHHADPRIERVARRVKADLLAVELDRRPRPAGRGR